jgi:hypothetical protein
LGCPYFREFATATFRIDFIRFTGPLPRQRRVRSLRASCHAESKRSIKRDTVDRRNQPFRNPLGVQRVAPGIARTLFGASINVQGFGEARSGSTMVMRPALAGAFF